MRSKILWILLFGFIGESLAQKDSSMKFDLGISKGQNVHLWPIVRIRKAPKYKNTELFFSLFQKKKDRNKFVNHSHLFPIYYFDSTRRHKEIKIATFYYPSVFSFRHNFSDSIKSYKFGELAPGISLVEATKSTDGLFVKNNAFLFLWYKKDVKRDKTYSIVFPLYWYFQNGPEKISTIFPVYWSYKNKDINNTILFPVVWNFKNDAYKSFTFIPLFSIGKSPSGLKTHLVVTPLFYQFKDTNHLSRLVLPVYWHYKTEETRNFTSLGKTIFYRYHKENTHLFPVYFSHYQSSYWDTSFSKVLFPVYWNVQHGQEKIKTFFPLYWDYQYHDIHNNIMFPVFWNFKNEKYKSFTFFPLFSFGKSPSGHQSHLMLTPIYWQFKDGNTKTQFAFPFLWHNISRYNYARGKAFDSTFYKGIEKVTFLFPLYFHKINKDSTEERMNSEATFKYSSNEITRFFPLYVCKRRTNIWDTSIKKVLFPVYFYNQNRWHQRTILFPLYFINKEKYSKTIGVTPFFWYSKSGIKTQYALFPVYWYKKRIYDKSIQVNHTFFPLWFSRVEVGSDTQKLKLLFPIFMYQQNWKGYNSLTILPFYSRGSSSDGNRAHFAVTPLYWQYTSEYVKRIIVFPLYWYRIKDYNTYNPKISHTLFPLFFSKKDNDARKLVLFPVIWYSKTITYDKRKLTIFPLYYDYKSKHKRKVTLFPLIWYRKTDSNFSSFVIFPVYWHYNNYGKKQIALIPFYYSSQSKLRDEYLKMVTPFYWENKKYLSYSKDYNSSFQKVLFPLYWYNKVMARDKELDISHTLFPLVWYKKHLDSKGNLTNSSLCVFPIFYYSKNKITHKYSKMITPFYWDIDNKFYSLKMVLPVYYNYKNYYGHQVVLFPLFWYNKTKNTWDSSTHFSYTFFPIVRYQKQLNSKGIPTGSSLGIFPLYYSKNNESIRKVNIIPFYFYSESKISDEYSRIIAPIYWDIKNQFYSLKLTFPFYLIYKKDSSVIWGNNFVKAITPLYWQWGDNSKTQTLYFPFLYKTESKNTEINYSVLGLIYRQQHTATYNSIQILWPLINFTRDTNLRYFHIAPLVWYKKSPEQSYLAVMPLFYRSQLGDVKRINFLWQLVTIKQSPQKKTVGILFHAFHYEKYKNNNHAIRFLYLLYADVNKNGNIEKSLFPIYYINNDTLGNKYFNSMLAFYARSSKKINQTNYFYTEERIFWIIRLRSNYKYLKSKGIVKSRKELR